MTQEIHGRILGLSRRKAGRIFCLSSGKAEKEYPYDPVNPVWPLCIQVE
jgi:hypothetical protein